jgi:hypothetical protein
MESRERSPGPISVHHDRPKLVEETAMNYSMQTCGWTTHLKIVMVALAAAAPIATVGICARTDHGPAGFMTAEAGGPVVKARKPAIYATRNDEAVR